MSPKEVHWSLTVDQYSARSSPEAWTSPLPTPPTTPETVRVPTLSPETPQSIHDLPLPGRLEVHPLLTPDNALPLDFSFPSEAFRRNPQLTPALLSAPACTPPRASVCVRIAAGQHKACLQIRHSGTERSTQDVVTVGDVLTTIQRELRQYDNGTAVPAEVEPYMLRRFATVNGYSERRSADARKAAIAAESEGGARIVDRLLGHTLFKGLTLQLGQPDHCWQLALEIPDRYAY
ncbi:hypothetical protein DFH06DRAFT_1179664 [Mycena polygramma]|nr:hypothetical protein DFH06DRAFT_1179664 [Mycena polygramma]